MSEGRILIVDDNPTNLKLACDVLEWSGYAVTLAADAEEALKAINQAPPDLKFFKPTQQTQQ